MAERYRRKSTEITAVQWDGEADGDAVERIIAMGVEVDFVDFSRTLRIKAGKRGAQGWVDVPEGHWVARAADDDFYPIDPDVFAATYEAVVSAEDEARISLSWEQLRAGEVRPLKLPEDDDA